MKQIAIFNKDTNRIARSRVGKYIYTNTEKGRLRAKIQLVVSNGEAARDLYEIRDCTAQQIADGK